MTQEASSTLTRDVDAVRIPSGEEITLPEGAPVVVTQALGGSFTVVVPGQPGLFRIQNADADALGLDAGQATVATDAQAPFDLNQVWEQLRNCYDPEIPVNIVDLGLIYSLEALDNESGPGKQINAKMTLTAPGCGMGPTLARDAEQRILSVPGVSGATVEVVWDPPWSPERISEAGKQLLGIS